MMPRITEQPRAVLVDDDIHSARLLVRTLGRLGGPTLMWYGRAARSLRLLDGDFAGPRSRRPRAIVVDLKGSSAATTGFIRELRARLPAAIAIAALAPAQDTPIQETSIYDALLAAGATAVFARRPDAAAYRDEIARLAAFLAPYLARGPHRAAAADAAAPTLVGLDVEPEAGEIGGASPRKFGARADSATDPLTGPGAVLLSPAVRHPGESEPFFV